MKTNDPTVRKRMKWIGMILLAVVAALGFSMGCGGHRMFPWLLPIHIQDCLYRNGSINPLCHP